MFGPFHMSLNFNENGEFTNETLVCPVCFVEHDIEDMLDVEYSEQVMVWCPNCFKTIYNYPAEALCNPVPSLTNKQLIFRSLFIHRVVNSTALDRLARWYSEHESFPQNLTLEDRVKWADPNSEEFPHDGEYFDLEDKSLRKYACEAVGVPVNKWYLDPEVEINMDHGCMDWLLETSEGAETEVDARSYYTFWGD